MNLFRYRLTPLALLLFLVAGWMLRQDVLSQSFLTRSAIVDITDGALILRENYMGFYLGDQKIGFARFILKEDSREDAVDSPVSRHRFEADTYMRITAMGMPFELNLQNTGEVNEDLSLRSFRFTFRSSGQDLNVIAYVDDEGLHVNAKSNESSTSDTIAIGGPIYLTDMIPLLVAKDGLTPGAQRRYPVFDPLSMAQDDVIVNVEERERVTLRNGESANVTRVSMEFRGFKTVSWITNDGEIYMEHSRVAGIQMTTMRESKEEAMDMSFVSPEVVSTAPLETDDLIEASQISPGVFFRDPSQVRRMTARVIGAATSDLEFTASAYQRILDVSGDAITVETQRLDYEGVIARLQPSAPPFESADDPDLASYLREDFLIQVNDPRIQAKAREIAGEAANAWEASEAIADYLYRNIRKEHRITIPSAVEVLQSMAGDCNEHATLFAALTRALGIPTKMAAGLVYMDGVLAYHAWNEVYVGGEWLPIDCTLYRIRMDAAYIKLAEGALDSQTQISRLIGNIQVEILEYEKQES